MALTTDKFIIPDGAASQGVQKMKSSAIGKADLWDYGIYDYRDLATQTTPITSSGGAATYITNDGLGTGTYKQTPVVGPTDLWNASLNRFEFFDLEIGDMIDIRLDLSVTSTANNQLYSIELEWQTGTPITIPFIVDQEIKSIGTQEVIRYNGFYIGNASVNNNPAKFKLTSTDTMTCEVHGWYMKLIKKGY